MSTEQWKFWIDRGGTFTDVIACSPEGKITTTKLLSENPEHYSDAAVAAMRRITGVAQGPLPASELRIGTTVATNALLEQKGAATLLAITRGFGDSLEIGYQERSDIFARHIRKPDILYSQAVEIDERISASGQVLRALDADKAGVDFAAAYGRGFRSLAIVLMHGYRYAVHEKRLAILAREIGFTHISMSHQVAPLIKFIARGDTALVDAYLSPVLRSYILGLESESGAHVSSLFMQSNGGLSDSSVFQGKDAILSGPAGGIIAAVHTAEQVGIRKIIGFDMGGTSTDVSHYGGFLERDSETLVAGHHIRTPMMRIHTVAAGGGSICCFEDGRFQVGPGSAGAIPGPACYRRGGPLTVTDCNVILGKIQPCHFPCIFGPRGDLPLDSACVRDKFAALLVRVETATGTRLTAQQAAEGFLTIAVANMANAIKKISVERGHDVTGYTLACFGGAGGQHACKVADALSMDRVMIHPFAGILSAYGMGLAAHRTMREKTVALPLSGANTSALATEVAALSQQAEAALREQHIGSNARLTQTVTLYLRHEGTDSLIEVAHGSLEAMRADFSAQYRARFGFDGGSELIVDRIRIEAIAEQHKDAAIAEQHKDAAIAEQRKEPGPEPEPPEPPEWPEPQAHIECFMEGVLRRTPLYEREVLPVGFSLEGPAVITESMSTTIVEPEWRLSVDQSGNLHMLRTSARQEARAIGTAVDPVRLEIFNGLFTAIAEEMGAALQNTASSVNIRERLDFSCALFDRGGNLVANAPHMPVHLGSMGESIRTIMKHRLGAKDGRGIRDGDVYALNTPFDGGTHLPDITVVMPVFIGEASGEASEATPNPSDLQSAQILRPDYYVASRGHHADIGGITPGSMPPYSRSVEEEGILLDNVLIVEDGQFMEGILRSFLSSGRWPSRNIADNIADLRAQIASCMKGAAELRRITADYGRDVVQSYMSHVQANTEEVVRRLITGLSDGHFCYAMDNGAVVEVTVRVDHNVRSAIVDFTGSSAPLGDNFNAPSSVVRAAVLYVVRTLVDDSIPMNEGCLRPISIIIPEVSMLNARYPSAVVAGNVETSQVVTDALFCALGAMAGAQGTMNNFTFGNERHQYYETIAGGSGAGPNFDGTSAVQTHMTNSRITDPEILEARFPVVVEEFSIRRGSGGRGHHKGGDGIIRRICFSEAMDAGILSNRRCVAPSGLFGGEDGAVGINRVERVDGTRETLAASAAVKMQPGDCFVIETPGGGGFGRA